MPIKRRERIQQTVKAVITKFGANCSHSVKYPDITDNDVISAIKRTSFDDARLTSPTIMRLKTESMTAELDEIEAMLTKDSNVVAEKRFYVLRDCARHPDVQMNQRAKRLQDTISRSHVNIIAKKYRPGTGINYLSAPEKDILKKLRPEGVNDPAYPSVVMELYWKLMRAELDSTMARLQQQGRSFRIVEGYYRKIKFFMGRNSPVPHDLKMKAKTFIQNTDKIFGKNVIPK